MRTPGLMGGFPCFEGTRVDFATILNMVDGDEITPDDIAYYYPSLDASAWEAAALFYAEEATPWERTFVRFVIEP